MFVTNTHEKTNRKKQTEALEWMTIPYPYYRALGRVWKVASVKGLVHPKMKIMSLMNHPHVVPSPSSFILGTQFKVF